MIAVFSHAVRVPAKVCQVQGECCAGPNLLVQTTSGEPSTLMKR